MVKIIMGLKGTGKTKALIDSVNASVAEDHGSVVCIEKGTKLRYDISHAARLISAEEYKIDDYEKFFGFVNGILAANFDITHLYIDSITKICNNNINMNDLQSFIENLEHVSKDTDIIITVSEDPEKATEYIKKHF